MVAAVVILGWIAAIALVVRPGSSRHTVAGPNSFAAAAPAGQFVSLNTAGPLAVAPNGALFVADVAAHRVLVRLNGSRFGVIAGTGRAGFSGDGGQARRAELSTITDLAVSPDGQLFIADGGRVRAIGANGVIRTVAGDGQRLRRVANGTPARSAALGSPSSIAAGSSWLSIAFSTSGQLYLSTGSQILRLTSGGTLAAVRALVRTGPTVLRGPLRSFGPIALDAYGNIDVAGFNGWSIWQVAPDGDARQVGAGSGARRSGGDYSVLERAPDGSVYAERGSMLLHIRGDRLVPTLALTSPIYNEYFWLTYFAFGPHGTIYEDELPGGNGFEARQQLISISRRHATLVWEQHTKPTS